MTAYSPDEIHNVDWPGQTLQADRLVPITAHHHSQMIARRRTSCFVEWKSFHRETYSQQIIVANQSAGPTPRSDRAMRQTIMRQTHPHLRTLLQPSLLQRCDRRHFKIVYRHEVGMNYDPSDSNLSKLTLRRGSPNDTNPIPRILYLTSHHPLVQGDVLAGIAKQLVAVATRVLDPSHLKYGWAAVHYFSSGQAEVWDVA